MTHHPLRTRAERAHLHVKMLEALPQTPEAEAFAEAIAWADTDGIADLSVLFALADAIDFHAYQAIHHSDRQFAEISADELRDVHGASTVNLALKLAGYRPVELPSTVDRQRGRKMIWTDAPNGEAAVPVALPVDLLEDWNSE